MDDSLTFGKLKSTIKELHGSFGPPPGPLVLNPRDQPWFHQEFPVMMAPAGQSIAFQAGLKLVLNDHMPAGTMAIHDGIRPIVYTGIPVTKPKIGAPRHRKLRLNRIRRQTRADVNMAAALATAYQKAKDFWRETEEGFFRFEGQP